MQIIRTLHAANAAFFPVPTTPKVRRLRVRLLGGGGGGMASQENMTFGGLNPIPYPIYGKHGQCTAFDIIPSKTFTISGTTITCANHGFVPNQCVFFSTTVCNGFETRSTEYHVIGPSITTNTFQVSVTPYIPPGVIPQIPVIPPILGWVTAFKYLVWGGSGGGIIGDQGGPGGENIGLPTADEFFGGCGSCTLGAGGRGGDGATMGGSGAIEQFGTLQGNMGYDIEGGGGSGGGMGPTYIHPVYGLQAGPSGGGGGNIGWVDITSGIKPFYYIKIGLGGDGGPAGPGGYDGGRGGHGSVLFEEYLP